MLNEVPTPPMQEVRTDWGFQNLLEAHADLLGGANVWGEKRGRIFLMGKISRDAMRFLWLHNPTGHTIPTFGSYYPQIPIMVAR
jgi:hypothetical protein